MKLVGHQRDICHWRELQQKLHTMFKNYILQLQNIGRAVFRTKHLASLGRTPGRIGKNNIRKKRFKQQRQVVGVDAEISEFHI